MILKFLVGLIKFIYVLIDLNKIFMIVIGK